MAPYQIGADLHTMVRTEQQHAGIRNAQRGNGLADQIVQAWRVDDVDLVVAPLGMQAAQVHRTAPLVLDLVEIAHRVPVLHAPSSCDEARLEQHRFGQGGLAATVVAKEDNVLDVFRIEDFHGAEDLPEG